MSTGERHTTNTNRQSQYRPGTTIISATLIVRRSPLWRFSEIGKVQMSNTNLLQFPPLLPTTGDALERKAAITRHMQQTLSTQHAAHSTQHIAHSTQHTAHSTQHTAHSTQHTTHSTQHTCTLADIPDDLALTCGKDHNCSSTEYTTPSTPH
jgi:hypothetical protein